MSSQKSVIKPKNTSTQIILDKDIQTPYPFCPLPLDFKGSFNDKRSNKIVVEKRQKQESAHHLRSILTISTWDGRTVMDLRNVNDR